MSKKDPFMIRVPTHLGKEDCEYVFYALAFKFMTDMEVFDINEHGGGEYDLKALLRTMEYDGLAAYAAIVRTHEYITGCTMNEYHGILTSYIEGESSKRVLTRPQFIERVVEKMGSRYGEWYSRGLVLFEQGKLHTSEIALLMIAEKFEEEDCEVMFSAWEAIRTFRKSKGWPAICDNGDGYDPDEDEVDEGVNPYQAAFDAWSDEEDEDVGTDGDARLQALL